MENPLAKISKKDWLYIGGAVASIVAVAYLMAKSNGNLTTAGPQAITDAPMSAAGLMPGDASAGYTGYNVPTYTESGVPYPSGSDLSPGPSQVAGCCCAQDCAGNSPLANGSTFGDLNALLTYYQNTNPNYIALQEAQLQKYTEYFAAGQSYSSGAGSVTVPVAITQA